ncbi:hypothetical protein Tco_1468504 [Tanacetum coccineum]
MTRMGFESKWCGWVEACLKSSSPSILVNGSPLEEFGVKKGVRQAVEKENAKALMSILRCFEDVLGLRVNFNNSKLYGLGVSDEELGSMASGMGCDIGEFLFTYLGLPIGENISRVNAWKPIVDKFKNCLANWKAKTMSFGGRLTLVKSVLGSLPLYYFSMFRVPTSVLKNLESMGSGRVKNFHGSNGIRFLLHLGVGG